MVALAKLERIYPWRKAFSKRASVNISIKAIGRICQDNPYLFRFAIQAHVARTLSRVPPHSCGDLWPGEASVPKSRDAVSKSARATPLQATFSRKNGCIETVCLMVEPQELSANRRIVYCRFVPVCDALNDWFRGQDCDSETIRPALLLHVAMRGPQQESLAQYEMTGTIDLHERTIRKHVQGGLPGDLLSAAVNPRAMKFRIDFRRQQRASLIQLTRALPCIPECIEPFAPALRTRSVACGKRHGFVQEEKLGVTTGRHHAASPALEFQQARNPAVALELADDQALIIVESASPVAH
jgi:hypothetical protein